MRALVAGIAGIVVLALAVAAFAPASLVDGRLSSATEGRLRIADASGTLWHGRGVLADARGSVRVPVQWDLAVAPLLRGTADVAWLIARSPPGRIRLDGDRIEIANLDVRIPAAAFADASSVGGEVRVASNELTIDDGRPRGALTIEWQRARVAGPPPTIVDLGTVTVRLAGDGALLSGPVEARGGHVIADGTLALSRGSARLDLQLVPSPAAPPAARDALALLGPPDARGAVRLSLSRELR